jgi:SAM-dependent methyltransferase
MDLVLSTSTLDHFETTAELRAALAEIQRVLRPGGTLIITLDNAANPLYWLLRWASRSGWTPFRLGQTTTLRRLKRLLAEAGFEVVATDLLIHNPRLLSTALFLALRRALGRRADAPIRALLAAFSWLDRLPTRRWTACFVAACARKPVAPASGGGCDPRCGA